MKIINYLLLLFFFPAILLGQEGTIKIEKTTSFFPDPVILNDKSIHWGFLTVPENWENPNKNSVKIAFGILKCKSKKATKDPLLFIEGGPGQGGTWNVWGFKDHPARQNSDIIIVDLRGTGNSLPKLCPELGNQFFDVLSKNQSAAKDEELRTKLTLECRDDIIRRGIDVNQFNSHSVAKDLNALKKALKYTKWNVFGVSYGTYVAQVYADEFPNDVTSIILDSPISDITTYYDNRNLNFKQSLEKVFKECEKDPNCNKRYPNLEKLYYQTVAKLAKTPLKLEVDKNLIKEGSFTFNEEDFKICIQQSLYNRQLIQLLPTIIAEFDKGNKETLKALVGPFKGGLSLDFGTYYCMSCNETIPLNSIDNFNKKSDESGGISFYRADYKICEKWNKTYGATINKNHPIKKIPSKVPVLIITGEFDPITPVSNGVELKNSLGLKSFLVNFPSEGHAPGLSFEGSEIIQEFISKPNLAPNTKKINSNNKINFITNLTMNSAVTNLAVVVSDFNILLFTPLFIAVIILITTIVVFLFSFVKKKISPDKNKLVKTIILITSLLGLYIIINFLSGINEAYKLNYFICAFGLPEQYDYLISMLWIYLFLVILTVVIFVLRIKYIADKTVFVGILFSLILISIYFAYWGFYN